MKRRFGGFTLIEILVVSTLVAVLSLAVFKAFSNALKLWEKAEKLDQDADVAILLDKMAEDLRSAVYFPQISFKGTGSKFSFPAIVLTRADVHSSRASEEIVDQLGVVEYRFDPARQAVFRRQANYAQALKGRWSPEEFLVASGVEAVYLRYQRGMDKEDQLTTQIEGELPVGVMVEVHFKDGQGAHQFRRFLPIPVGGGR